MAIDPGRLDKDHYGHYYATRCVGQLPPGQRPFYQDHLARITLSYQEADGSWWDFPFATITSSTAPPVGKLRELL
jgi:hypothetical protein